MLAARELIIVAKLYPAEGESDSSTRQGYYMLTGQIRAVRHMALAMMRVDYTSVAANVDLKTRPRECRVVVRMHTVTCIALRR
jgi:hypothetical protein